MYAYFGKLENKIQLKKAMDIIDTAWDQAVKQIPPSKSSVLRALKQFDIRKEKYSESASSAVFGQLAKIFRAQKLDFYTDGMYWNFRNNVIKNLGKYLIKRENLMYFLNTIYFYTYDDPRVKNIPCPYKLLIGKENMISEMKDVSSNADLKNILLIKKPKQLDKIKFEYDGKSQSFKIHFQWKKKKIDDNN